MNTTIIFGTKKLGQVAAPVSKEKYPNQAVITVEGLKAAKKSRRVLLNSKAAELLKCEVGSVQNLVFASVEMGENAPNQVLIANADIMEGDVDVTYKTSKNKVSYEDSSEKGKAITSSHACSEIFRFLDLDDSANVEFEISAYDNDSIEAFQLGAISEATDQGIALNSGEEMTTEEVVSSVQDVVAQDEANDNILGEDSEAPVMETQEFQEEPVLETASSEWE